MSVDDPTMSAIFCRGDGAVSADNVGNAECILPSFPFRLGSWHLSPTLPPAGRRSRSSESSLVHLVRIPFRKKSTAAFRCRSSVSGSVAMP